MITKEFVLIIHNHLRRNEHEVRCSYVVPFLYLLRLSGVDRKRPPEQTENR